MKNLGAFERRLEALEAVQQQKVLCHVAYLDADGKPIPSRPGTVLGATYAIMPRPCATTAEWLERIAKPAMAARGGQVQSALQAILRSEPKC